MSVGAIAIRVGALVLAVGLIVGAFVVRGGDDPVADGPGATPDAPVEPGTVVCATELRICDDLARALGDAWDVTSADGVDTARDLQSADAAATWVTAQALVDVVEAARDRSGRAPLLQTSDVVASSPLVMVGFADRLAVLDEACGAADWSCVGDAAGGAWSAVGGPSSWGDVRPGHAGLDRSVVGLLVAAQAAAGRLDSTVLSTRALDESGFATWFARLEQAVPDFDPPSGSVLTDMIVFGTGSYDVVGTTAAEALDTIDRAGTRAVALEVRPVAPEVAVRVVVAGSGGTPGVVVDEVARLLGERRWDLDPGTNGAGGALDQVTDAAVAFDGGQLEALILRWERIR